MVAALELIAHLLDVVRDPLLELDELLQRVARRALVATKQAQHLLHLGDGLTEFVFLGQEGVGVPLGPAHLLDGLGGELSELGHLVGGVLEDAGVGQPGADLLREHLFGQFARLLGDLAPCLFGFDRQALRGLFGLFQPGAQRFGFGFRGGVGLGGGAGASLRLRPEGCDFRPRIPHLVLMLPLGRPHLVLAGARHALQFLHQTADLADVALRRLRRGRTVRPRAVLRRERGERLAVRLARLHSADDRQPGGQVGGQGVLLGFRQRIVDQAEERGARAADGRGDGVGLHEDALAAELEQIPVPGQRRSCHEEVGLQLALPAGEDAARVPEEDLRVPPAARHDLGQLHHRLVRGVG